MSWRWTRRRLQDDQTSSATDQTAADEDQTASDTDQSASDRDQSQADADQRASERDQDAADRDAARQALSDPHVARDRERSRAERVRGTLERNATAVVRAQVSFERDEQARHRDEVARSRDRIAEERDRAAEEHDREIRRWSDDLDSTDPRAGRALLALAEMRDKAAASRGRAAEDRKRAGRDREAAAADRRHFISELGRAQMDDLTGAYRREMGEIMLVNEIERARRADGALAFAFLDCDDLKQVNDRGGHAAGDKVLRELIGLLRSKLRPYDPVVRWGGDEFICAISGADSEDVRGRFSEIQAALSREGAPRVTIGIATLEGGDTFQTLIDRADTALLDARSRR
jgi:diguanylate cyclase (GGDEF)-like protein